MHLSQLNSPPNRCGQCGCGLHWGWLRLAAWRGGLGGTTQMWLRTWAWAMLVMLALACGTLAQAAEAAEAAPLPAAPGLRFKVAVDAPEPLQALLVRHLNIQRFHDLPDLDQAELRRLANQVPADVRSLLGTQGYFSPTVQTRLQAPTAQVDGPSQPPDTAQPAGVWTVHITVQPGPVSVVGNVLVAFTGEQDTAEAPDVSQLTARERVRSQWPLTTGTPFSQAAVARPKTPRSATGRLKAAAVPDMMPCVAVVTTSTSSSV